MLILTRKIGQGFIIGDDIMVRVLSTKGSHVSIGIDAPKEVVVLREELQRKIQKHGHHAATS